MRNRRVMEDEKIEIRFESDSGFYLILKFKNNCLENIFSEQTEKMAIKIKRFLESKKKEKKNEREYL